MNVVPAQTFALYDFENGDQGWVIRPNMMISRAFSSDAHAYEGKRSLAIAFDNPYSRKSQVYIENPPIKAARTVTAHILCPSENQLEAIAWFVEDREYTWSNDWQTCLAFDCGWVEQIFGAHSRPRSHAAGPSGHRIYRQCSLERHVLSGCGRMAIKTPGNKSEWQ